MSLHKFYDDNVQALGSLRTMSTSQHWSLELLAEVEVVLVDHLEVRIFHFHFLNHHHRAVILNLYPCLEAKALLLLVILTLQNSYSNPSVHSCYQHTLSYL